MKLTLEKPADRLITERIQLVTCRIDDCKDELNLTAWCGNQGILFRDLTHPFHLNRTDRFFYSFIVLQELIQEVKGSVLEISFSSGTAEVGKLTLIVSPMATRLATEFPLDMARYALPRTVSTLGHKPHTLVFPGLGAAGGSSINFMMRYQMFLLGWSFPVYSEANDIRLWRRIREEMRPAPRWIDGHCCYSAAAHLERTSARVTLLREPIGRAVSIFNYCSIVHPDDFPHRCFTDFLNSESFHHCTQAYRILKWANQAPRNRLSDQALSDLASLELDENYSLVGITELFEETVFAMSQLAGFEEIGMWWRVLSAPKILKYSDLGQDDLDLARVKLKADILLYQKRKQVFEEFVTNSRFGESLDRYKDASNRQDSLALPDEFKIVECLRWRQLLKEEELAQFKTQLGKTLGQEE